MGMTLLITGVSVVLLSIMLRKFWSYCFARLSQWFNENGKIRWSAIAARGAIILNKKNVLAHYYFYGCDFLNENYKKVTRVVTNYLKWMEKAHLPEHHHHGKLYYLRGRAYFVREKYDKALHDFNKVFEYGRGFIGSFYWRAKTFLKLNKPREAINDLNMVLHFNAQQKIIDYEIYSLRATAHEVIGDIDRCLEDINMAIMLEPNHTQILSFRSRIYCDLEAFDKSMEDINRALDISPDNPKLWFCRGMVYDRLGDKQRTKAHYQKALELDPHNPDIKRALKELA